MDAQLELHIERLVLHGVEPKDRQRVAAALQVELHRLLSQDIPVGLDRGVALAQLKIDAPAISVGATTEMIGVQIAQAIYSGFAQPSQSSTVPEAASAAGLGSVLIPKAEQVTR